MHNAFSIMVQRTTVPAKVKRKMFDIDVDWGWEGNGGHWWRKEGIGEEMEV